MNTPQAALLAIAVMLLGAIMSDAFDTLAAIIMHVRYPLRSIAIRRLS